jgi:phospholipid transport system transporter-binding protein
MQLPATLTIAEAAAVHARLQAEAGPAGAGPLRIDAAALEEFDTSALAVLLELRRGCQAAGRTFELLAPPLKLRQLATLYGVHELLGLTPV